MRIQIISKLMTSFKAPPVVVEFVNAFDNGLDVEPFEFELEWRYTTDATVLAFGVLPANGNGQVAYQTDVVRAQY